ncbi:transmembrane protein, putative (macronuclear) [Tetrahymena thermophila SB210]|uniref:Transmembrane protein, putative n=1 Tax=Tetrahymena thermophila (strain SB210) TaxID=312017 RepID=W7XGR9_TETTS|nr:transmembrane protein, putative [Tetrahymena thermophila SB210]EWS73401.1 transmembrane protein, putative [Tetrahymena thermophila SB210]|eukprot:XP_012654053.1 transmembrane protein, putative [Tetrahymena thermophila SB210]
MKHQLLFKEQINFLLMYLQFTKKIGLYFQIIIQQVNCLKLKTSKIKMLYCIVATQNHNCLMSQILMTQIDISFLIKLAKFYILWILVLIYYINFIHLMEYHNMTDLLNKQRIYKAIMLLQAIMILSKILMEFTEFICITNIQTKQFIILLIIQIRLEQKQWNLLNQILIFIYAFFLIHNIY